MNYSCSKTVRGGGDARAEIYDWLRLIATVYVVIGHSAYLTIQTSYGGVAYVLPEHVSTAYDAGIVSCFRHLAAWVYGFHMPLFFCLSGAVLGLKPVAKYDSFIAAKVKRLLIPYYLYGWLFMFPVKYAGNFYNRQSAVTAVREFLSGQDSGHLWFLPALFWCMVCFVSIQKILSEKSGSIYMLLFISGIVQLMCPYLPFDVLGLKRGLGYLIWFALGYVFEYERTNRDAWNMRQTVLAFVILTLIEILHAGYGILDSFFLALCGSFYTYLAADICSRVFKNAEASRVWNIVIRNLFYVYLFHDPLEYIVLRIFFERNLLTSSRGCYLYMFCRTVFVFIISMLLGEGVRFIKKRISVLLLAERIYK